MGFTGPVVSDVNDVIYCIVQCVMSISIVGFMVDFFLKLKKMNPQPSLYLCLIPNFLLNAISLFCIGVISFQALCELLDLSVGHGISLFFPCNLVYFQNIAFICVLFLRSLYIFKDTIYRMSKFTQVAFFAALSFSVAIYVSVLGGEIQVPDTDTWVNCMVTLCIINLVFTVWMQSLFMSKLATIVSRDQENNDRKIRPLITKSALLSSIAMTFTIFSCLFLLLRFSLFGDSIGIRIISKWLVSTNIYLNFISNTLFHPPYHKLYKRLCGPLDRGCDSCCLYVVFGGGSVAKDARKSASNLNSTLSCKQTTASSRAASSAATSREPSQGDIVVVVQDSGVSSDKADTIGGSAAESSEIP